MSVKDSRARADGWTTYVGWWRVAACVLLLAAGLAALLVVRSEAARWGWFGWLGGVGLGGLLAEVFSVADRREDAQRHRQLLEAARSRARAAYRIGEFSYGATVALQAGDLADRHVTELLGQADSLGIRTRIADAFGRARPADPNLFGAVRKEILLAVASTGEDASVLFELGTDLFALRGKEALAHPDLSSTVAARVAEKLAAVSALTYPVKPAAAWERFAALWQQGRLTEEQVGTALDLFHGYLLSLGAPQLGGLPYARGVARLEDLRAGNASRVVVPAA